MTRASTLPRGVRAARLTARGSMSISDWMALAAAGSGVVGTVIIFAKSYALPPSGLSGLLVPLDPLREAQMAPRKATERPMIFWQRVGLGFLCLSFALQVAVVVCPKL